MLIAASDALENTKDKADYVCTGTDDQEQIEAAINALHPSGDTVQFSEGTFNLTEGMALSYDKVVRFCGQGPLTTTLAFSLTEDQNAITINGHHHAVRNLGMSGVYRVGVLLQNAGYTALQSLRMFGPTLAGVRAETSNCVNRLVDIEVMESAGYGFWLYGVANRIDTCHVRQPTVGGLAGFRIQGTGGVYTNIAVDNKPTGIFVTEYARSTTINGAHLEGCGRPLDVRQATGLSILGLVVRD